MQAQRYGALPIAHATGGLGDTIEDGETGFLFSDFSAQGLHAACRRAFNVYADAGALGKMRQAAMARRFHWSGAAEQYEKLYGRLTGLPGAKRSGSMMCRSQSTTKYSLPSFLVLERYQASAAWERSWVFPCEQHRSC